MAPRPLSRQLSDLLGERAAAAGDALALVAGDVVLTYGELDREVDRVAGVLAGLGVRRGSTVGLLSTNRWEWLGVALGAHRLGARVAAFNTFARAWDLGYMLEHSGAELLVAVKAFRTRDYVETLRELLHELDERDWHSERFPALREVILLDGDEEALPPGARSFGRLLAEAENAARFHTSAADDAFVLYTSGSSARPKAVALQHYAAVENGFEIGERAGLTADDRVFVPVPLFWSYGAVNALPATLGHGAALVLQEAFEPGEALELIERWRCTAAYTLPNLTNALVEHPAFTKQRLASVRTGLTLGTPSDIDRAAKQLGIEGICNIYGSTETLGNCCVTPTTWPLERRSVSQGPPLPGVELRVVDPESERVLPAAEGASPPQGPSDERVLPAGEVGALHVRGYLAREYLGDPDASAAAFGADGWYRTGDLAALDETGALRFAARATEMIKTGGINVAPSEVEEFLALHERVREVVVVGVPDDNLGQRVVAAVVAEDGPAPDEGELRAFCARRIAGFKVPARVHVLDALPATDTGKTSRRLVAERCRALEQDEERTEIT